MFRLRGQAVNPCTEEVGNFWMRFSTDVHNCDIWKKPCDEDVRICESVNECLFSAQQNIQCAAVFALRWSLQVYNEGRPQDNRCNKRIEFCSEMQYA